MFKFNVIASIAILSLLLVSESNSQIIFDNGAGGAGSNSTQFASDFNTPIGTVFHAEDVQLSTQHTLTGIQWTGTYFDQLTQTTATPAIDDFNIMIFLDNAGEPASAAAATFNVGNAVNRTDTGIDLSSTPAFGEDVFEYSAAIDFTLDAGTTYWFSIVNNSAPGEVNIFHWGGRSVGNAQVSEDNGINWRETSGGGTLDFRLEGFPVPEPGSTLIIACAGALALVRRRTA